MKRTRVTLTTFFMLCVGMVYAQDVTPAAQGKPFIAQPIEKPITLDEQGSSPLVNKGLDWMGTLAKAYNLSGITGQNSTVRAALTIPLAIALSKMDKRALTKKLQAMGLPAEAAKAFINQIGKPDIDGDQPYEKFVSLATYLITLNQSTLLPMIPAYLFGKNVINPGSWTGSFINLLNPSTQGILSFDFAKRLAAQTIAVAAITAAASYTLHKIGRASGLLKADEEAEVVGGISLDPALIDYFKIKIPLIDAIQKEIVPQSPSPFNVMQKQILASYVKQCTDLLDALYNKNMPPTDAEKADFEAKYKKLIDVINGFKTGANTSSAVPVHQAKLQPVIVTPQKSAITTGIVSVVTPAVYRTRQRGVSPILSGPNRSSTPQRTKAWRTPQRSRSGPNRSSTPQRTKAWRTPQRSRSGMSRRTR